MAYITTRDNAKLYVKDWGSGKPVILLHGWPLSADSWDDQAMAIAQSGMRVIAYDRRGFGRSEQPWDGYNYDTLSDDLADVIKATGATDAAIIGFSMGGGDRAHFFASFFKDFYGTDFALNPPSQELLEWSRTVSMQASLKATLACAEAFATTDFRPDLPSFSVPTLIIHGTQDKTVPIDAAGRAAARGIAQSKLIEYDGAPHGLFATQKEQFTSDLLAFLKS